MQLNTTHRHNSFILVRRFAVCLIFFICYSTSIFGQYYTSAFGKNGAVLKTALHNIIKGHTVGTYAALWTDYYTTDKRNGNQVWDIYSDIPGGTPTYTYTLGTDQCTGTSGPEGYCYNREHTWPKSYFGGIDPPPMYTDVQHIFPTDGYVNGQRGDLPYGKVNSTSWTSQNGSKTGSSTTYTGSSSDVFEPIDSFKGDLARVYFYMSTRYEGEDAGWLNWEMANGAVLTSDAVTLLMSWHHLDPVSQKEVDRNNAIYAIQGNRNPFIDYPQFADCIWGTADCTSLSISNNELNIRIQIYPIPCSTLLHIQNPSALHILSYSVIDMMGRQVEKSELMTNEIPMLNLDKGIYILLLNTEKGIARKVFSKE